MASSDVSPPGSTPPRLVRAIGRFDLTAAVLNGVVGAGIFGAPAAVAAAAGAWSPLAALGAALGITGFAMTTPRILFAMGERGELPRALSSVHARYRTPHVAVAVNSALALGLAVYGSFAEAASLSVVTRLGIFALTCAALPVLRRLVAGPARRGRPGPARSGG
jgi:amino acid transporter